MPATGPAPMRTIPVLLLLGAALGLALGCASTRTTADGVSPVLRAGADVNPASGPAVRIARVEDRRVFGEFDTRRFSPSMPGDPSDAALRARTVGRQTTRRGDAGTTVTLPAGQSVELLAADAMARALRGAGFRVLDASDPGHAQAAPLTLAVEQLWIKENPPGTPVHVATHVRMRATAGVPGLDRGLVVETTKKLTAGGMSTGLWRKGLEKGLDTFTEDAQAELAVVYANLGSAPAVRPLANAPVAPVAPAPAPPRPGSGIDFGRYHLLAIGIDSYEGLPRLKTAVSDAQAVAKVLSDDYGFQTRVLVDATRADIIKAFSDYRERLGPQDNLLIYYAGHGWNDEAAGLGYWLPVDAAQDDETNWVSNAKITSILRAMQAKHVMVVSDSCYSGTLTRGIEIKRNEPGYMERLSKRRTRLALASGGNEPVVDGGGGGHSVFANAFLRALRENENVLDATSLHAKIRKPVMRDADQTPQFGPIRRARHEDGDFFFVRER